MGARKVAVATVIGGAHYDVGAEVPDDVAELVTNPAVWGADSDSGDGGEKGYSSSTVKELQAEIDRRNEDRDEDHQIVPAGNKKADLIAALEADDDGGADSDSGDGGSGD